MSGPRKRPDQSAWLRNDDNSVYTVADAILHASFLNSCLRHCGSIAMTNLSPLVNTRGPIFTHPEGVVLRPVYHVRDLYRSQLAGEVLDAYVRMPSFEAEITSERIGPLPWGDAVATVDRPAGTLALSLANPHPAEPLECVIWVPGRTMAGLGRLSTLTGASPEAFNDISHPDDVSISRTSVATTDDSCRVLLQPHSVNILRLETADAER